MQKERPPFIIKTSPNPVILILTSLVISRLLLHYDLQHISFTPP